MSQSFPPITPANLLTKTLALILSQLLPLTLTVTLIVTYHYPYLEPTPCGMIACYFRLNNRESDPLRIPGDEVMAGIVEVAVFSVLHESQPYSHT